MFKKKKSYKIDWGKVKTFKDLKEVIKNSEIVGFDWVYSEGHAWNGTRAISKLGKYLKEVK